MNFRSKGLKKFKLKEVQTQRSSNSKKFRSKEVQAKRRGLKF